MEEQKTNTVRPTKKQRELLTYIDVFIGEHGYSPSYREIMNGLGYNSVATVALHVKNLMSRGHLVKRDHSARSIEVVHSTEPVKTELATNQLKPTEEKWLVDKIEYFFHDAEQAAIIDAATLADLQTLVSAMRVLGLGAPAATYASRLHELETRLAG